MKKYVLPALIAVIIIQLSVPAYMITDKYYTLRTGEEFKFRVYPVDPYDAFRGRYVNLNARQDSPGGGMYGVIAVERDGFAYIEKITDKKPQAVPYVKSGSRGWFAMPIDRYYMDEKLAPKAESLTRQNSQNDNTYVTARVKNGKLVITGLFIDGMAIEDIIGSGVD